MPDKEKKSGFGLVLVVISAIVVIILIWLSMRPKREDCPGGPATGTDCQGTDFMEATTDAEYSPPHVYYKFDFYHQIKERIETVRVIDKNGVDWAVNVLRGNAWINDRQAECAKNQLKGTCIRLNGGCQSCL